MSISDDLAAALNNHQVTDEEGQVVDETTSFEDTAAQEKNTEEETAPAEKPAESEAKEAKTEAEEDETQLAEDESGKKYVPEKRFKEVYGKLKQQERELEARDVLIKELMSQGMTQKQAEKEVTKPTKKSDQSEGPSKADLLELRMTLPQFDPKYDEEGKPTNADYSPELDKLGYQILKANPGMTPLEAGRQALKLAKDLSKAEVTAQIKAREMKSVSSDQGITSRVTVRGSQAIDPDRMTDQEIEEYLRSSGQW